MTTPEEAWEELSRAVRACTTCTELAEARTTVVVGVRPPGFAHRPARVLLVGEAPGAQEDAEGVPFVGRAGQLLDGLLGEAGVPRESVAVANVLKCRPPGNRKPTRGEVRNCASWLRAQIELIDPQVILALGGTAAEWFLGPGVKIGRAREETHTYDGRTLLISYHPSAAIRFGPNGAPRAALEADLHRLAELAQPGHPEGAEPGQAERVEPGQPERAEHGPAGLAGHAEPTAPPVPRPAAGPGGVQAEQVEEKA